VDTSPGTLGEFLESSLNQKIVEEEEAYGSYRSEYSFGAMRVSEYRSHRMRAIQRLQAAKQILKTLEEHELEFEINLVVEKELRRKLGFKNSIFQAVRYAKRGIRRRPQFKTTVTVLIGKVKVELPEEYWK
jgi:hypothetical protein